MNAVVNFPLMAPWMRAAIGRMPFAFWLFSLLACWLGTGVLHADKKDATHRPPWVRVDGTYEAAFGFTGSLEEQGWRLLAWDALKPRLAQAEKGGPVLFGSGAGVWDDRFSLPGLDGVVYAVVTAGTNVYVGGAFTSAGGVATKNLARWDGALWHAVGGGVEGTVRALAVDGTSLWVGGDFTKAGGQTANGLAKWVEANRQWTVPDAGIAGGVRTILILSGVPYVGGEFDKGIVRQDADGWAAPGDGVDGAVFALAVNGSDIVVGGAFANAGGSPANNIARLQDTNWLTMGNGVDGPIHTLAVKATNALYAGGAFGNSGPDPMPCLARWNGKAWEAVSGANTVVQFTSVEALQVKGGDLFVGGDFDAARGGFGNHVLKYDGTNWATLVGGVDGNVLALATNSAGLFVGGAFQQAGGAVARGFAFWSEGGELLKLGSGLNGYVNAVFVANDQEIYVAGEFTKAGASNVSRIARWDGTNWFPLADGLGGTINALVSDGVELYAGGTFTNVGGVAATNIARWNGASWAPVGDGFNGPVQALAVVTGQLVAGGSFTQAGEVSANHVARWNGSAWSALGDGLDGPVQSLVVRVTDILAGGNFLNAGSTPVRHVAKWDGRKWVAMGEGVDGPVSAMTLLANGDVVVGGRFSEAGTIRGANNLARWDGAHWSILGIGVNGPVRSLQTVGGEVYAGGSFNNAGGLPVRNVARWIEANQAWALLLNLTNNGVDGNVFAIASTRSYVYLGGIFTATNGVTNMARIQRSGWLTFGNGVSDRVRALAADGTDIYAGGAFTFAGGVLANNVARWDGTHWSALGSGVSGAVSALAMGSDGLLYVGGTFTNAGGLTAYRIARWDGFRWSTLGIGLDGPVLALAAAGTNLYAAGEFTRAGGFGASRVARWDGARWSALSTGCNDRVRALAVGSDGNLYAGGDFTEAGGVPARRVACWDGTRWTALGTGGTNGFDDAVLALAATADGVYAGGRFTTAGGRTNIQAVAFWDGASWMALGQGLGSSAGSPVVQALAVTPGGGLQAGGSFSTAGGASVNALARWNRTSWSGMDKGLSDQVTAMVMRGRDLFVGGDFMLAGTLAAVHFCRWSYLTEAPSIYFTSPEVGAVFVAPAAITLGVDAFDLDGAVRKVDFLSGTNVLATVTNAPFTTLWTNVLPGIYSLTARATDNDGLVTTTSALLAVVNTNRPPFISWLSPTNGTVMRAPAHVRLQSDARDADGRIVRVDYLAGTNRVGSAVVAPFDLVWSNTPPGVYQLKARAFDNSGASNETAAVRLEVLAPVPPVLEQVTLSTNGLELAVRAPEGRWMVLEASTNLVEWVPLSTNTTSGELLRWVDPDVNTIPYRFYRAVDTPR